MFYFLVDLLNFSVYYNHSTPYRCYQRLLYRPVAKTAGKVSSAEHCDGSHHHFEWIVVISINLCWLRPYKFCAKLQNNYLPINNKKGETV